MRSLLLTVQSGPDRGRQISLRAEALSIGRGASEGLQLSDSAVSRHHLTITGEDSGVRVVEIAGVNPVWTVEAGNRVALRAGQVLPVGAAFTVGNSTIAISIEEVKGPGARALELDATGVLAQPGASRLAALAALGEQLARCGSLPAVMRAATSWAVDALPAARALLLSPDGSDILSAASVGPLPDLALSPALLARVLRERRGVLLHDVLAEPDLADRRSVQMRGITGAMAAPVEGLIFYVEWGPHEALQASEHAHDNEALRLLVCAAQLVSAIGDSARERQQLGAAARHGPPAVHGEMIGRSAAIQKVQVLLERVAATTSTVLVLGESGTGKELAAGMIHALSPPRGQALRGDQLRRDRRVAARERAVRPREGRVHRGGRPARRRVRAGARRHPVHGRGRRAQRGGPGPHAPGAREPHADPRRRDPRADRRCPPDRRDAS